MHDLPTNYDTRALSDIARRIALKEESLTPISPAPRGLRGVRRTRPMTRSAATGTIVRQVGDCAKSPNSLTSLGAKPGSVRQCPRHSPPALLPTRSAHPE